MGVLDARTVPRGSAIETDVCIVGAGAAGLTLAGALSGDLCVIEAGDRQPDPGTQALYDLDSVGHPVRPDYMSRARYYGGTCNLWAGRAMKLGRADLEGRSWLGDPGWPIGAAELDTYYGEAARVLGLPVGEAEAPMQGASQDELELLEGKTLVPNVALWARKPLRFGRAFWGSFRRPERQLLLNANATDFVLDASGSRVEAVHVRTLEGNDLHVRARVFVLAAGGLENARLLLASRSVHASGIGNAHDLVGRFYMDHPRVVYGRVQLARPVRLPRVLGIPVADGKIQLGVGLSEEVQRQEGLLNSYVSLEVELSKRAEQRYQTSIGVAKVVLKRGHAGGRLDRRAMQFAGVQDMIYLLTPKEIVPHPVYRAYSGVRRRLRGDRTRGRLTLVNYCEQLPQRESRVYLSDKVDRLGMSRLVLDWKVGAEERRSIERLHAHLDDRLRGLGMGQVESDVASLDPAEFTDASHHMGTTRMSRDPKQGVVDPSCRVHGMGNLFVAGSSVFPSCGYANPTWTIVALSLRLAEHLKCR